MLVCLAVKEMNELRFVLVPKSLSDEQFWAIYFALTRNRLPPEAFDVLLQRSEAPPPPEEPKVWSAEGPWRVTAAGPDSCVHIALPLPYSH
jgi:BSD domain